MTPDIHWRQFINHLAVVQPLDKHASEPILHTNFIGSVVTYKKIFIEANTPDKSTWID